MRKKILGLMVICGLLFTGICAETSVEAIPKCDNRSTCVNNKDYYLEVKRVDRRGDVVIIQLEYTSKAYNLYTNFTDGKFEGYVMILDAKGQEFVIKGKEISNFHLKNHEKKVLSFRFKGVGKKRIIEPFDLIMRTNSGEITLFDLKEKNRFK